jgi:hypothetical protein
MKKLIITFLFIIFSQVNFSQESTQFRMSYNYYHTNSPSDKKLNEGEINVKIFFNYASKDKIRAYFNDIIKEYTYIGDIEKDSTKEGYKYQLITTYDEESGDMTYFQLFESGPLRIIFNDESTMFLYNK